MVSKELKEYDVGVLLILFIKFPVPKVNPILPYSIFQLLGTVGEIQLKLLTPFVLSVAVRFWGAGHASKVVKV